MKRIGNLYEKIISLDNLRLADEKARRGKLRSYGVHRHDQRKDENILNLHEALKNHTFKTSEYHIFKIVTDNGKEREIYRLPYFPDRIVHHAIMNIMEPIWTSTFTADNFSGDKIKIDKVLNREMTVLKYKMEDSKFPKNKSGKCLHLQIELSGTKYIIFSGSDFLMNQLKQISSEDFPFTATIIKTNDHFELT